MVGHLPPGRTVFVQELRNDRAWAFLWMRRGTVGRGNGWEGVEGVRVWCGSVTLVFEALSLRIRKVCERACARFYERCLSFWIQPFGGDGEAAGFSLLFHQWKGNMSNRHCSLGTCF